MVKACIEEGSHHLDVSGEPLVSGPEGYCLCRWPRKLSRGWSTTQITYFLQSVLIEGYTTLNIHEIWPRLFRGEHLLYIRAKMTSFVNSHD